MDKDIKLHTRELAVGYGKEVLIPDITFSVNAGEILVLIGPNGAGKSTILKTITRQLENMSGTVFLEGKDMHEMKENEVARKMSLLMTRHPKVELMTVEDMVGTGRYPYTGRMGIMSEHDNAVVKNALEMVELIDIKDKDFNSISDGQRQRVMLARAICQEPEILVMDEPTSFLDIHHKLELLSMLKRMIKEKNIAVILSLHELDLAGKFADHLLCVKEGHVDRYGTIDEIFNSGDNYINELYDVHNGKFIEEYGSLELEKAKGEPSLFVIGGGGKGIPLYRKLQREGIPFIAGVIHENDVEYPIANALATRVITERAYEPIGEKSMNIAREEIKRCDKVICVASEFGTMNHGNKELMEFARVCGKLEEI